MNTQATIDPFIVAMISAMVIASGTARWALAAATVMTVNTISITKTVM